MQTIRVIYTKRLFNPISWLIRWTIPQSRFCLARSSHSMVVDGDSGYVIEAHMIDGVRRVPLGVALRGAKVVKDVRYPVEDAEAGLSWFRGQLCTYVPQLPAWLPKWLHKPVSLPLKFINNNYDFKGAIGLGIAPDRDWQNPVNWHCYEGSAGALKAAGLDVFSDTGYITEITLLAIRHQRVV